MAGFALVDHQYVPFHHVENCCIHGNCISCVGSTLAWPSTCNSTCESFSEGGGFMRKAFLILAMVVLLGGASSAFADGGNVNYTATSSTGGESFTFTFSEPSTITSLTTFTTVDFSEGSLH